MNVEAVDDHSPHYGIKMEFIGNPDRPYVLLPDEYAELIRLSEFYTGKTSSNDAAAVPVINPDDVHINDIITYN